ncbi:hypothetical protein [Sphingomonas sp.]|uniref:hypothetical protein n=1 Tax=Sphingomonas sp. TaxID=28214 RepID=UPI00286BE0AA|nr:hypothetical protein [Sphingomonas sp.]
MHGKFLAVFGVATMLAATAATAQEYPVQSGDFWSVSEVTIDDGHFGDYADFLGSYWRKQEDFAKSKGWIKDYHILSNPNKRASEPDLYLVEVFDHVPTAVEGRARDQAMVAAMNASLRQQDAGSAARAKFRHLGGSQLLQELIWTK